MKRVALLFALFGVSTLIFADTITLNLTALLDSYPQTEISICSKK